jgi:hypothetical protein
LRGVARYEAKQSRVHAWIASLRSQ